MKILIIGGTNFIGHVTAEQLTQSGHDVILFHRSIATNIQYRQLQGNCNNIDDLGRVLEMAEPDVIIHTIALFQHQINILEQALQGKKRRVLILSSMDVYKAYEVLCQLSNAPVMAMPLNEQSPLRDIFYPYRGKLETDFADDYEKIFVEREALQSPVMDVIILRLGMVYGKNDHNHRFLEPVKKLSANSP
ncbi:MAG: NAD-dependent epimerase/dehydratase family protein [Planctomycetaceae bacterium]|jgi:nucleoside-diphosphate-sugar epimerase|nr:NAD-dependent epimerase/dehydratase family protein [Planctomycetaceae bacterium]